MMIESLKNHRLEIGLLLALAGIQFSLILKSILGWTFELTNIIFAISLVLIPDYQQLLSLKIPLHGNQMTASLRYNVYVAALALLSGASMWVSTYGVIYTLYTIVFIIALMTNTRELDGKFFVTLTWAVTGIFSVLLFYLVTGGLSQFGVTITTLDSGAGRLSLSVIAFYYLCVMLLYHPQNIVLRILKVVIAIVALYDVMACSRRGLMVALIIIFLYHLWQSASLRIDSQTVFRVIGAVILVIFALWVASKLIPGLDDLLSGYIDKLVMGVNTYFGNTSNGTDAAAINRNININNFGELFSNGTVLQQLFGHGYAYFWMDVPYLEAFIDLGILGGAWYLIIQLIMPLKVIFRKTNDVALRFSQYFAIIAITYNLYSGLPYGQYKFVPVIILFYVENTISTSDMKESVAIMRGGV